MARALLLILALVSTLLVEIGALPVKGGRVRAGRTSCVLGTTGADTSISGVVPERTKAIFQSIDSYEKQAGGAGGSSTLAGLVALDKGWGSLRSGGWATEPPQIVRSVGDKKCPATNAEGGGLDVAVVGGTLGIFYAFALQKRGHRTCVIERGTVSGRAQEWNISRKELQALVSEGILSDSDIDAITAIEFNPVRVGFKTDTSKPRVEGGEEDFETYVRDVLNLGVRPDVLLSIVKEKYLAAGGVLFEGSSLQRIDVYSDGAALAVLQGGEERVLSSRLVIDATGNQSPISRQMRGAVEPDGICIVVGTCASGFSPENNTYSDLIYTDTPVTKKNGSSLQYFWEAFPTGTGPTDRTTYLFTYMDCKPERPGVFEIMEDYWDLLPRYQGKAVGELQLQRVLYGCFPTYRASPLQPTFDRLLSVGDASGIQSPLSFGGFGSLTRHILRISTALDEALRSDLLAKEHLGRINAYQPSLSIAWMFQKAMSVGIGMKNPNPRLIVGTLSNSFRSMEKLGDAVMLPFLQDVLQFIPLSQTLLGAAVTDPLTPFKVIPQVGVGAIIDFVVHFFNLAVFTFLANYVAPALLSFADGGIDASTKFRLRRLAEQWKFGSGLDYYDHE